MTPPSDRERILCAMFESFCVAAIRNFGRNLRRAMRNHQKYDGTGEVSVEYLIGLLSSEDVYASEQFVLDVDGLPCVWRMSFYIMHCYPCLTVNGRLYSMTFGMTGRIRKSQRNWRSRCARCITSVSVRLRKSVHIMSYMGKGETPKLNYALIKRAVCGDEAALEMILQHFDAYINTVSTVEKTIFSGEIIKEVDEDMKIQIQMHLVKVIQEKWSELI